MAGAKRAADWRRVAAAAALIGLTTVAQAQSARVPLNPTDTPPNGLGAAPQDGTLAAIEVDWGVAGGTGSNGWDVIPAAQGGPYGHYNGANQTQTWTFSKPVDVSFIVLGLNGPLEGVRLPSGTRCQVPTGETVAFDAATGILAATTTTNVAVRGRVQVPCQLHGATTLTLVGTGREPDYRRGLGELVLAIPEITAVPTAAGTVAVAYGPESVAATDSDPDDGVALTYTVASGALPPGLSLDPDTGEVTGTPTTDGTYTFQVVAANGPVQSLPRDVTIVIAAAPVVAPPAPVPTLEGAGLGLLAGALALLGLRRTRRRPTTRRH